MAATKSGWHLDMIEILGLVIAISERAPFINPKKFLGSSWRFSWKQLQYSGLNGWKNVQVLITTSVTDSIYCVSIRKGTN